MAVSKPELCAELLIEAWETNDKTLCTTIAEYELVDILTACMLITGEFDSKFHIKVSDLYYNLTT